MTSFKLAQVSRNYDEIRDYFDLSVACLEFLCKRKHYTENKVTINELINLQAFLNDV